jgi:hypothetical protein
VASSSSLSPSLEHTSPHQMQSRLQELDALHSQGAITDQEYQSARMAALTQPWPVSGGQTQVVQVGPMQRLVLVQQAEEPKPGCCSLA